MMQLFTYQPFKTVYALSAVGFELLRLPLFIAKFVTSYGRPHPKWTFRQALVTRLFFSIVRHIAVLQVRTPEPLEAGEEKERWTTIKPANNDMYQGPLGSNADVKPAEIGATWYPAPLTSASDKSNITVILHIHGGAFVTGSGRTKDNGPYARRLLKHTPATHVLCPQYRLSTLPASKTSNPFPAALQDTLTSYLFLLNDLQISPKDIIVSGDSAGANLIMSLLRYIVEYGSDLGLPNPSAALLWSPWVDPSDMTGSFAHDNPNYATDYLSPAFTHWGSRAYAGLAGPESLKQPYVNHKIKTFKTEVPMWVNTGGAELLFYDDKEWAEKMEKAGNDVTLMVEETVPHDVLLIADTLGFPREGTNCAKAAGEWMKSKR